MHNNKNIRNAFDILFSSSFHRILQNFEKQLQTKKGILEKYIFWAKLFHFCFTRCDINNQTLKSYKFYLFILRGILKTKIEYVFFFQDFIPKKIQSLRSFLFSLHTFCLQSTTVVVLQLQPYIHSFKTTTELFDLFLFLIPMCLFTTYKRRWNTLSIWYIHGLLLAWLWRRFFAFTIQNSMVILGNKSYAGLYNIKIS